MPVDQTQVVNIVCDNPACPGNQLDPHDRAGWTFINAEVYGDPPTQFVYCSAACAGSVGAPLADAEEAKAEAEAGLEGNDNPPENLDSLAEGKPAPKGAKK